MSEEHEYSKSELINVLKHFEKTHGKRPTKPDIIEEEGYPPMSAFTHNFGSWSNAIMAAFPNVKYDRVTNRYIEIDEEIFVEENDTNVTPATNTIVEVAPEQETIEIDENVSGDVIEENEISADESDVPSVDLLADIIAFEKIYGRLPSLHDMSKRNGFAGKKVYLREFGSMNKAIKEAFPNEKVTIVYGHNCSYIVKKNPEYIRIDDL